MRFLKLYASVGTLALLAASVAFGSWQGLVSSLVGVAGTGFYLYATWLLVKLVGTATKGDRIGPVHAVVASTAVMLKLPLIYLGWTASQRLGPFGPTGFLLGLGLVYSVVLWRAVLTVRD